ncbi:helix-turn-helix domain-containing protein [Limosilactobacillus reuteri]|uniref:helix-turn-helix domain-containing protein n=1 Tax=Limosilactobacillus reuteri TaxID=1598 RepID=UPI00129BF3D1|nr:helix-turn-helix transcriptional regulator [Limosilactobacillus reuteri]MCC4501923.1 helix-turn-helix domain-containing protein [Limosilactobacillus reuteri]MRI08498.1 XRE family transcriptional regulator [Limosilactobacillus reuteri]
MKTQKLKGEIVGSGMTLTEFADEVGISRPTFYRKIKDGSFTIDEAIKMAKKLNLSDHDILYIFFAK